MLSSAPIGHSSLGSLRRASLSPPTRLPGAGLLAALRSSHLLTRTPIGPLSLFFRSLMEPLEEPEMFWAPIEQAEQGLYGFLGDLQISIASGSPRGLQIENSGARVEDAVLILQLLEEPQDEANLNDWLSGDLHPSPLLDTTAHYQTKCRSGRRGTQKRRTSLWNPTFFESRVSREYTSRKNNSRWTPKEVEILVQGVSKFGVGRWAMLKRQFFKTSIRTSVNLKDKWRNLLKAYQGNSQKNTQLYLEPSLVEQIRKLAEKHPYPNKRHK